MNACCPTGCCNRCCLGPRCPVDHPIPDDWKPCEGCGELTLGQSYGSTHRQICRECDIEEAAARLYCDECGELTNLSDFGRKFLGTDGAHAPSCSKAAAGRPPEEGAP
ncbi:MAG TPA: hypothetical protein VD948_02385 [Rhodothermales bacterium]|nr:hypothetical protein [Rhodothermales bacterium]